MSWRSKSYEVLPALSVRGPELRSSLRTVTIAWMFGIVWMVLTSGTLLTPYAKMIGFDDRAFGIMGAMPFFATFGQLIATVLVERTGLRKFQFLHTAAAGRMLWLVIAAIPLMLPIPSVYAVFVMLFALGMTHFMNALATPAWLTWMGDLIPRRIRGRYMAQRGILARIVQITTIIALGIILDAVTVDGAAETALDQPLLLKVSCIVLAAAAIFGTIDIVLFKSIRELKPTVPAELVTPAIDLRLARREAPGVWGSILYSWRYVAAAGRQFFVEPLKDASFRNFVGFGAMNAFSMACSGWFLWRTGMEHLGFSKLAVSVLFMVLAPLTGIATVKGWGRLNDRFGRRPALVLASSGTVLTITPWLFASPQTPCPGFVMDSVNWVATKLNWVLGTDIAMLAGDAPVGAFLVISIAFIVGGVCWSGVNIATMGLQLGFSDGKGRSKYVASYSVLVSIGGVLGGLAGGELAARLGFLQESPIGPFQWNNWHATFLLAMLARAGGAMFASRIPDPGASKTSAAMRFVAAGAIDLAIHPWRIFRPARRGGNGRRK